MAPAHRGFTHGMGTSFQPQNPNNMQNYPPSQQQHGTLPPPAHTSYGGGSSSASPFAMNTLGAAFDNNPRDAAMLNSSQGGHAAFGGRFPQTQQFNGLHQPGQTKDDLRIRNVWKHNLHKEMATIRQLIDEYPFVAMDTEFPGIVARPIGQFRSKAEYHYHTLRCNVDLLKMIQLGITLFKTDGSLPPPDAGSMQKNSYANITMAPFTWQFNFRFDLETDMYAQESTNMLSKAGIDFNQHSQAGIEPRAFAALLISSGLVLDKTKTWISFHSGYDFAYLIKMMRDAPLPDEEAEFHKILKKFFPSLYDIKYMLKQAGANGVVNNGDPLSNESSNLLNRIWTKMGLQDIAEELAVSRIGQAHQAGSDALLTGQVFFKMRDRIFNGTIDAKYNGQVWGLNSGTNTTTTTHDTSAPNLNGAVFYPQAGQPSTPQTNSIGMASSSRTPGPPTSSHGFGTHTPGAGAGAGAFGQFSYAPAART